MKSEAAKEPLAGTAELVSRPVPRLVDETEALAALLDCAARMPLKGGLREIARTVLDTLARQLPSLAFGVCLVEEDGAEPWVELRLPVDVREPGRDPTRLFPDLEDERIFALDGLFGSTLHMASTRDVLDENSREWFIVSHAASLLAAGGRAALALRAARPVSVEVSDLRRQLMQAEKLATLGQIVAGIVHELSNPVTSIVACTDYLLKKATAQANVGEEVEQLRRIGTAADRILKFSRDLVSYSRPAQEAPGPVALPQVVQQAYAFSQHELERNSIQFACDYEGGAPPVLGQSGPLTQVFVNLFTNAAHAMGDHGGRLSVRTRAPGDGVLYVEVTDSGVGIAADVLPRIFDPFFTTKEKGRGTGLGLSIVREIMEAHGGTVEAASTSGEGTTFTLSLPVYTRSG